MAARAHILIVNGRTVAAPVFVLSAPGSGADLVGAALKRSQGFHVTIGHDAVQGLLDTFAASPSIRRGRGPAAAGALRDALAGAWQVTAHSCLECSAQCRDAGGVSGAGSCVQPRDITRYGDASPGLLHCAGDLVAAFPDARLVQLVRDGRDAVAAMLADPAELGWLAPGRVDLSAEFPNPALGVESGADRAAWPRLSPAGKCALRWRGAVRAMARLRAQLPAGQLATLRYETLVRQPEQAAATVSGLAGAPVAAVRAPAAWELAGRTSQPGAHRALLTPAQLADVEAVAGPDLRRVGYLD